MEHGNIEDELHNNVHHAVDEFHVICLPVPRKGDASRAFYGPRKPPIPVASQDWGSELPISYIYQGKRSIEEGFPHVEVALRAA